MNYCEHCGGKLEGNVEFCPNCGAKVIKKEGTTENIANNNQNNNIAKKDNTTAAFVCSIIGFLCCTYVAIPGLILSIMSLKDMNEGKISSKNKWMAIVGIVLSCLGLITMIFNFIYPARNKEIVDRITEQFNLYNGIFIK